MIPYSTPATFPSDYQEQARRWFQTLRDDICTSFEALEDAFSSHPNLPAGKQAGRFERNIWEREGGGGGTMSVMKGRLFEKVGVNISTVFGQFSPEFRQQIPGTGDTGEFWASGISLVAHMRSPHVPAVHMNTRLIVTSKAWFGGGADLTPMFPENHGGDATLFHGALQRACDATDASYYPRFKKWCDEYFFLPHRNEPRGLGGIFYDQLNTGDWGRDFAFTQDVGKAFRDIYPEIVRRNMAQSWTPEERQQQLVRRGRYVEFNLLYDRGTTFGLKTGGNTEAILMSLPPEVAWP
ncbi:oxygen-dependent coproporphyrinogen oxidase [Dongia rigui]|uniref:Oxygen-dependent coproporphyrinogen-III oxidase n=1 Tax=Dongia rigui TaxID=940149 RepID=A0ABU5DYH6_9PROT|nr:oxygen-dependent coproporphyrinogen oxidase [Dongia rigui]MDY0872391.1 oxygen-dependent coproporphyrinogen oxidase [Dongia rigui]